MTVAHYLEQSQQTHHWKRRQLPPAIMGRYLFCQLQHIIIWTYLKHTIEMKIPFPMV
jgi:hypothetical protein